MTDLPRSRLRLGLAIVLISLIVCAGFVGHSAYAAYHAYRGVTHQMAVLNAFAEREPTQLSSGDLVKIELALVDLEENLRRLDAATTLPLGGDRLVEHVPWLGPRLETGRGVLQLGTMLADAGATSADIGQEVLTAYESTGVNAAAPPEQSTWLDVVTQREPEIQAIAEQINAAKDVRAGINDELLPVDLQERLSTLDAMLARFDSERLVDRYLPALGDAFGAEDEARYLVLFQNPDELRPSGGFPGTAALVTVERGQLRSYEFFDTHVLTRDYMAQRSQKLSQPWPIETYFPQDGFLLHDATWFADFPESGAQVMEMYAETDWPAIQGIVAVEPAVVADLLRITGPITLEVDGGSRTFTADNVHDNIELQRLMQRDERSTHHKEVIADLGKQIIHRLTSADRETVGQVAEAMLESLDRRDIQVYAADPSMQSILDERRWSGRLVPDANEPTVAATFANVALGKSSRLMIPRLEMTIDGPNGGYRRVDLRFELEHTGTEDMHPFYGGFQRWWIDVALPSGSTDLRSDPDPISAPDTPNGGSYVVELFPGQTGDLSISFAMPDASRLSLRRQPGLTTVRISVVDQRCESSYTFDLSADVVLDLTDRCSPVSNVHPSSSSTATAPEANEFWSRERRWSR